MYCTVLIDVRLFQYKYVHIWMMTIDTHFCSHTGVVPYFKKDSVHDKKRSQTA